MEDVWVDWDGSHPKGPRDGVRKGMVRFRDGGEHVYNAYYDWSHHGAPGDIVAYQILAAREAKS